MKFSSMTLGSRENILGKLNDGWSALTSGFNVERAVVAANYLGYAERIFREVLKIANHRTCNNRVVGSYDAISQRIAEFAIEIQAHRLLTYRALWMADEKMSAIEEVSQSKVYGSELIKRLGDFAMEVAGGPGYLMDSLTQWFFRESKIVTIGGGSSQMMRNLIGATLGLKAK